MDTGGLFKGSGTGRVKSDEQEESITINGQKYRPIKESDPHTFKEIYDRTFRSLK